MLIETRFSPNDSVWIMEENKPRQYTIIKLEYVCTGGAFPEVSICYTITNFFGQEHRVKEEELAKTLDELKHKLFG